MKKVAVYPGSFDPITKGHLDILERGLNVFDEIIVAVARNSQKTGLFTYEERVELIKQSIDGNKRVKVDSFSGLLVDYVKEKDADVILRGLRAVTDFEYEFQIAQMNSSISEGIETFFMMTSAPFGYLSSSIVRELASLGGPIDSFVPEPVKEALLKKCAKQKE